MLYVEAKINGHQIQAFCDSGAQTTIMSKKVAMECGLADYIDERFAGMAVGVGTGKILGRIHMVQLEIGSGYHFPCSVTVMDDPAKGASEMPFLLGLDMMKRHTCQIDLEKGVLRFRLEPGKYMETPFLHEKDLSESQGGTKGFDAAKANEDLMKRIAEAEEKDRQEKK
jgi:DNA damage-inducible protein 1